MSKLNVKQTDTEQAILESAEAEFLEKGYDSAKTVEIAKRAGVSHSMLHYYFRKKENLFQMVFQKKVQIISAHIEQILETKQSFSKTVKLIVETQFDFIAGNPKLPLFIMNEILSNKKNRSLLFNELSPKIIPILKHIEKLLKHEIRLGRIRPIKARDFIMNLISLNVSSFLILPIFSEISPNIKEASVKSLLEKRKKSNVEFILNALRV